MAGNHKHKPRLGTYGIKNPPPDREAAIRRADLLRDSELAIKNELLAKVPEDFPSDLAYKNWRAKANVALGHAGRELSFLEDWLRENHANLKPGSGPLPARDRELLAQIADKIQEKVDRGVKELKEACEPYYDNKHCPKTLSDAHKRREELSGLRTKIQGLLGKANSEWCSHPLSRERLKDITAPLKKLLWQVEEEAQLLRKDISNFHQSNSGGEGKKRTQGADSGPSWREVCVAALDRAKSQGFELTVEEESILSTMREYIAARYTRPA